jgi:hypothetical protein
VFAEVVAVVAGVDDDRVVGEAEGIEGVEETCDVVVDAGDVAEVVEMDLVGGEAGGFGAVGGGFVEDGGDPAVRGGAAGLAVVKIAETGWDIVAAAGAVRAFEAEDDGERLFLVLADEVDGEVGGDVVGPALGGGGGGGGGAGLVLTVFTGALAGDLTGEVVVEFCASKAPGIRIPSTIEEIRVME